METALELFVHELRSCYDGERREARALKTMERKVTNPQLLPLIADLRKASEGHVTRLEEAFQLIGEEPRGQESSSVKGLLKEFSIFVRDEHPASGVLDVYAADHAMSLAQEGMDEYESLMQLAERAGLMHSIPKLGDLFEPGMKEERRLARKLKKVSEKLVDKLRPS
jgi:ferritin-like metal-binding protein YciE